MKSIKPTFQDFFIHFVSLNPDKECKSVLTEGLSSAQSASKFAILKEKCSTLFSVTLVKALVENPVPNIPLCSFQSTAISCKQSAEDCYLLVGQ